MTPNDCKRFPDCSCPVCPLDSKWRDSVHLKGEPICFYLREHSKLVYSGAFQWTVANEFTQRVHRVYLEVLTRRGALKRRLETLAQLNSKTSASFTKKPIKHIEVKYGS